MSIVNSTSTNFADIGSNGVAGSPGAKNASLSDGLGKDTFLKLLIAQIRNQDPLNPTDGAQFLAQLAQFSQLEQLIDIRDQITNLASAAQTDPSNANSGA